MTVALLLDTDIGTDVRLPSNDAWILIASPSGAKRSGVCRIRA